MRFFVVLIFCVLVYLISAESYAAVSVVKVKDLYFGDQVVGVAKTVVVAPTDSGAASFNATGMTPGRTVTCSIRSISAFTNGSGGANNKITLNAFTINGCTSVVPATGNINGIGVGATATITAAKLQGAYTGTATFRLVMN